MTASSHDGEIDPEDLRDAIADYNATCESVLERFGPPLSQSMGDGLLAYFGYPKAYGDDAKRAVTAGLEIVEAVARLSQRFARERSLSLSVSVGIHTGIVVVGEGVTKSLAGTIAGQAPDQALQVEARAGDNSVVVSAATERLLRSSFESESLGRHTLRGTAEGTELFRVAGQLREAPVSLLPTRSKSLVGRASELGLLLDRWEQACSGSGQVVFVSGEAGLGKSRLLEAAREDVGQGGDWLECACSPYFSNTALYPILQAFAKRFGLERGSDAALSESRLEAALRRYELPQNGGILLAHAFDLAKPAALAKLNLSPPRQKQALLEALAALLLQLCQEKPVALVVEDLHWADPSTLDWLSLLVEHCAGASLLVILSARPEFVFPWAARSNSTELKLGRLSAKRVEALVRELTGGRDLPRDLMDQLLARTDGIPLFVEELTRMVIESGGLTARPDGAPASPRRELSIPSTLRDSLTARLDRLGPAKVTAQLAATIGREFSFELLSAISPLSEAELRAELSTLIDADLIFQRGLPPNAGYTFRHSLIQEAAYDSLLKKTRREAHSQIAQSVIERFPERANAQPEFLAHHFEQAELVDEASQHLTRAGQRALERSALAESAQYLTRSLSLLASQPPTRERLGNEALTRTALGVCLMFSKGYAAAEVEDNYGRALVIDRELGGKQPLPVLWGLWIYHHVRGRYQLAQGFAEQLLTLARESPEPNVVLCSHLAHGSTALLRGLLETAREHLQRTLELYTPEQFAFHAHMFGQDPGVFSGCMQSWNLWLLGHPQRARLTANAALKLGRDVAHPNSLAFALAMKSALHTYCGEAEGARALSEELLRLCGEQGLAHWVGLAQMVHGWAIADLSPDDADAVEQGLREALVGRATWQAIGTRVADTHWAAMLVDLHCRAAELEPARAVLANAFSYLEQSDERSFEAELHRLKGELFLRDSDAGSAEQCFKEALAIAERQKSHAFILRTSVSLYRLYEARGEAEGGRALLTRALTLFEAGESTRDLVTARRLLAGAS